MRSSLHKLLQIQRQAPRGIVPTRAPAFSGYRKLPLIPVVHAVTTNGYSSSFLGNDVRRIDRCQRQAEVFRCYSQSTPGLDDGRKRVVFLGSPEVAAQVLQGLLEHSEKEGATFRIQAVVTQPARPKGRGFKITPTPVETLAREKGFPEEMIMVPETAKDEAFLQRLRDLQPDLCITAAYGNFLPQKFLDIPKYGTLNIHPSLLPKYRGAAPVPRSLENGDEVTGVSVLYTVLKMDAGPVLAVEKVAVDPNVQTPQLLSDLFRRGTDLLVRSLPTVWAGKGLEVAQRQDEAQATHAAKFVREETQLDFSKPARVVHNKVRAFAGWPGTSGRVVEMDKNGRTEEFDMKILETRVWDSSAANGNPLPGKYEGEPPMPGLKSCGISWQKTLLMPCGDSTVLEVLQVQLPSKKPVSSSSYVNGLASRGSKIFISHEPPVPPADKKQAQAAAGSAA